MGYMEDGQCDAKKVARFHFWNTVSLADEVELKKKRVLVLLGPDSGDLLTLLFFGVPPDNVVGVDFNSDFVNRARERYPQWRGLRCGMLPGCLNGAQFDVVFLDFCGHVSRKMAANIWRVADRAVPVGGLIGVGFQRGREKVDFTVMKHRIMARSTIERPLESYVTGVDRDKRASCLQKWMVDRSIAYKRKWWPKILFEIRYQSTVPMSFCLMRKCKKQETIEIGGGTIVDTKAEHLRPLAVEIARTLGSLHAMAAFGVPKRRIAAWLATANRQGEPRLEFPDVDLSDLDHFTEKLRADGPDPYIVRAGKAGVW